MNLKILLTFNLLVISTVSMAQDIDLTAGKIEAVEMGNRNHSYMETSEDIDLTEGKIEAAELNYRRELLQEIKNKEIKSLQLINYLAKTKNDRFSSDLDKGDAEYAYYAYLARFQSLKEDHLSLENIRDLKNYSLRFDQLIRDLQKRCQ